MKVISHEKHLGLKNHILSCGDLTETYESIIMLEDDLVVAPYFYQYAVDALAFYDSSDNIAGISLYSHLFNESAGLPFTPLQDQSDVYFIQLASSWGQAWNKKQWKSFRHWYDQNQTVNLHDALPQNVIAWPETSWKKYFIKYLVQTDRFFVYPRYAYTTNFSPDGVHQSNTNIFQVPLTLSHQKLNFVKVNDSLAVYDAYCELMPRIYKHLNNGLVLYDFTSDLYGKKNVSKITTTYLLTTKKIKPLTAIKCFNITMKPMELNIAYNIKGDVIQLVAVKDIQHNRIKKLLLRLRMYEYFYRYIDKSQCILYIHKKIMSFVTKQTN